MKRLYTLFPLFALLGAMAFGGLSSCSSCVHEQEQTDSTSAALPLVLDSIVVRDTLFAQELARKGDQVTVDIVFRYPQADTALQRLFIRDFFGEGFGSDTPQASMANYLKLIREEYLSRGEGDEAIPYDDEFPGRSDVVMSNRVSYADSLVIAITKDLYTYSNGAAHGLEGTAYTNIDRRTKTRISEGDLFVDGYATTLAKIMQRCLLRDYQVKTPEELMNQQGVDAAEAAPNDNFAFEATGLVYSFNPYEIAPYAAGIITVHIPYEELQPILRPGSLIFAYLPTK